MPSSAAFKSVNCLKHLEPKSILLQSIELGHDEPAVLKTWVTSPSHLPRHLRSSLHLVPTKTHFQMVVKLLSCHLAPSHISHGIETSWSETWLSCESWWKECKVLRLSWHSGHGINLFGHLCLFLLLSQERRQHTRKKMENQSRHAVDEAVFQELHVYK